jgi:hypothetical protein
MLGGGVLALLAFRRRAGASESVRARPSPPGLTLPEPSGAGTTPPGSDASSAVSLPPPSSPPATSRATAPLPAWNRRSDDGGPLLFIADDVEALARVITSEIGNGSIAERVAVGWIARNLAREQRGSASVARLVCSPCGESSGNARPFSTRLPATAQNRELAAMILASPQSEDPTQGATHCFEPGLQDRLHASGRPENRLDARGVRYCWLRGLDYYGTIGRWDLFGPKGGAGTRPVPKGWNLTGYAVCCPSDKRTGCRGKRVGERVEE